MKAIACILLATAIALAAVMPVPAFAASAKQKKVQAQACSFQECVRRGISGENRYSKKFPRAGAIKWCRESNNGC
jgi:hypothetical protein